MQVIFVGSNHNIRQLTDICTALKLDVAGILDQDYWNNTQHIDHVPVIGSETNWTWSDRYCYFIATNWIPDINLVNQRNQQKRLDQIDLINRHQVQCINLIHPTAIVPDTCELGAGIMIGANVVVGNYCKIGDYCQVREQSYLAHSSTLGRNVVLQVQSYIGSSVTVEDHGYIGIKSSVIAKLPNPLILPKNSFVKSHSYVTNPPG